MARSASQHRANTYGSACTAFLDQCRGEDGPPDVASIYHAVRNIPYASRGQRDPMAVLTEGEGSCSGKHLLLRDLLRSIGQRAEIETAEGDFAAGVPVHPSMQDQLRGISSEGGVRDFHHYVVWDRPEGELKLDATWPDSLAAYGFSTNTDWDGTDDTKLALEPVRIHGRHEDIISHKRALLDCLSEAETQRRTEFLRLLTDWLSHLEREERTNEQRGG